MWSCIMLWRRGVPSNGGARLFSPCEHLGHGEQALLTACLLIGHGLTDFRLPGVRKEGRAEGRAQVNLRQCLQTWNSL